MTVLSLTEDYGDPSSTGIDLNGIQKDQYKVLITTNKPLDFDNYALYRRHKECEECPYRSEYIDWNYNTVTFSTQSDYLFATTQDVTFPENREGKICDLKNEYFGEFGIYNIYINDSGCTVTELHEPVSIYMPILTVILIYAGLFSLIRLTFFLKNKYYDEKHKKETAQVSKKERVMSLDTFRGIAIVVMIFANYGCGGYEFIEHAVWDGLHIADLVFPWFMWIMGACIPISLSSSIKKGISNSEMVTNVLIRSLKLFALGIFLGSGIRLDYLRIFGVLQRFGICYFFVTTICIFCMDRTTKENKGSFGDILKLAKGWIIVIAIVIVHTLIIFLVTDPDNDCPMGYMGPGGLHKNEKYYNCTGGATGYIDRLILGKHIYQTPTISEVYEAPAFDPEGILGCLTSIFHVFLGVQAGTTLLLYKDHFSRVARWLSWGAVCGLIGGALCGFSKGYGIIPVNKNLWSLSFVMVTSCFAFTLLSVCYVLIDIKKWWSGKPFLFAGMNSILMYIGHSLCYGNFPVTWQYVDTENYTYSFKGTHFLALLSDVWGTSFWVLASYYLYKINYFFSL